MRLRARHQGWEGVEDLELATLSWVHWFNDDRLHGYCGDMPPAEFEAASTLATNLPYRGLETNSESLHQTQGDSHLCNRTVRDDR